MHKNGLIGIAAPQIGENYQVFITEPRETDSRPKDQTDKLRVYINPKIVNESEEEVIIWEGCGSVLNGKLFAPVKRPKVVTVKAHNKKGKKFRFTANGILGRVIQHEYDHMLGVEFLEKVHDPTQFMALEHYKKRIRNKPKWKKPQRITVKKYEPLE